MKRCLVLSVVAVVAMALMGGCISAPPVKLNVAGAKEFVGKAEVLDGDTIVVVSQDGKHKVRMASIDAPEMKQPFGPESKAYLAKKIDGKDVRVTWTQLDKYGRAIGQVYYDNNRLANVEMVAGGYAWQYTAYSTDPTIGKLQDLVKSRKIGLWSQQSPVPPWEFRKHKGEKE